MQTALYICYFNTEEPLVHTQVLPYLRLLARAGVTMHLLTYEKRGRLGKTERARRRAQRESLAASGIQWHSLKYHKRPSLLATGFDLLAGLFYSAWLIARHRVDTVHARSHVPGAIGLLLKRAFPNKLIFDFRGLLAEEYVDNGVWAENSLPYRLVKRVEAALVKNADHIVVLTERLKEDLVSAGKLEIDGSKISVIPCCVDLSSYSARQKTEVTAGRLTLVYAGSATGRYMLGEMIDFFKALKRKVADAHFLVITKTDANEVRRAFRSRDVGESSYTVTGAAPDEVPALLCGGDIGISFIKPTPALAGASPTKIGEYLAAGLPVVTTAGAGDTDCIIRADNIGVILDETEPAAYEKAADQVVSLLGSGAPERCREVARARYSLGEIGGPRYIAVYESLKAEAEGVSGGGARAVNSTDSSAACPACRSTASEFIVRAREGIRLRKCSRCGLAFHNEFLNDLELREYYSHYYHQENMSFSPITEARFQALVSTFESYREANRILDVGCGAGHLLKVAVEKGWSAYGTEIASGAFEQLSRLGTKTYYGELQSANYEPEYFDVVYCSEVIEHLLDPVSMLRESARVLRRGGLLYLTTPNYNSLSRRLLGGEWRVFGKEHICYFTPRVLEGLAREVGFAKVSASTRNIDPHELRKVFGHQPAAQGGGFQAERTEQLRERLETNPALGLAKRSINTLLSLTGSGDTICLRAEK